MTEEIPKVPFFKKNKIEFEIFKLSSLFARRDKIKPPLTQPHSVDFYRIMYISNREGTHHIDFKPYQYTEGSILKNTPANRPPNSRKN